MWLRLNRGLFFLRLVADHAGTDLCAHPSTKICFGIPDILPDPVPSRAITSSAPDPERFHFNAKKARYPCWFQQRLYQTFHDSITSAEIRVKTCRDGYGLGGNDGENTD
jgi:hypothetical protein